MKSVIPQLHVGRSVYLGGVTVFPVWSSGPVVRGLDTGPDAHASVSERAGSPVVGELVVSNDGPRPVLLLDGELLEGGWQHRTLVHDLILAPGSSRVVDVACVEQGRWSGSGEHGRRARRASVTVRAALLDDECDRQLAVWSRVQSYQSALTASPTASLVDHLEAMSQRPAVADALPLAGQRGVILGIGGQPLALELFGSTKALAAHLPVLLTAARLDAALLSHGGEVPGRRARRMVAHLDATELRTVTANVGDGRAVAARTTHATLTGVTVPAGDLAHLSVLNTRHPLMEMSWPKRLLPSPTALPVSCSPPLRAMPSALATSSARPACDDRGGDGRGRRVRLGAGRVDRRHLDGDRDSRGRGDGRRLA